MYALGPQETVAGLEERRERLEHAIAHIDSALTQAAQDGAQEIVLSEERYAQHMRGV